MTATPAPAMRRPLPVIPSFPYRRDPQNAHVLISPDRPASERNRWSKARDTARLHLAVPNKTSDDSSAPAEVNFI